MSVIPQLLEGATLYAWQRQALDRWIAAKHRGTMKVVTGAGKTLLGLAAIDELVNQDPELRVAIVVPTVVLQRQWLDELVERSQGRLNGTTVALVGGGKSQTFSEDRRILIAVLNSASRHLAAEVRRADLGSHLLLIVDEVHRSGAKVMSQVFQTARAYSLGLSATPERAETDDELADGKEQLPYDDSLLGSAIGPIVFELTLAEAVDQGVLPPFAINHYGVGLTPDERAKYDSLSQSIKDTREQLEGLLANRGRSTGALLPFAQSLAGGTGPHAGLAGRFIAESQERKRLLYRADARASAVGRILRRELGASPTARALLFHESIAEVEALASMLDRWFPGAVAMEHSNLSDSARAETIKAFREGRLRVLVSVRSLIEGFNVPAADVGIIVASSSSVRQRVQTIGRLLRRHTVDGVEEKHSVMHVLYVRDTVDDSIYGQEDWEAITGAERNTFYHYLPPDEPEVQTGPPRRVQPKDSQISDRALIPGERYSGRYVGTEFSADTQGNIKRLDGTVLTAPADLWAKVTAAKGGAGRFMVSPTQGHVLVRIRDADGWATRYVTSLAGPLETAAAASRSDAYQGPTDTSGGEFSIKRSAAGFRIARGLARGRGLQMAKRGRRADEIIAAVERVHAEGHAVARFRVNRVGDAIAQVGDQWVLLAHRGDDLEF